MDHHVAFETARASLTARPFDFVITNLRLSDFNGLHLVHLVSGNLRPPRCIVYTDTRDAALAREVQRAGAFYETAECLPVTLSAYLRGTLPGERSPQSVIDRSSWLLPRRTPMLGRLHRQVPGGLDNHLAIGCTGRPNPDENGATCEGMSSARSCLPTRG